GDASGRKWQQTASPARRSGLLKKKPLGAYQRGARRPPGWIGANADWRVDCALEAFADAKGPGLRALSSRAVAAIATGSVSPVRSKSSICSRNCTTESIGTFLSRGS